jgi:hypothetical protein
MLEVVPDKHVFWAVGLTGSAKVESNHEFNNPKSGPPPLWNPDQIDRSHRSDVSAHVGESGLRCDFAGIGVSKHRLQWRDLGDGGHDI